MKFFVEINGHTEGPFTVEQVEALHGAGRITRSTRCRPEGGGDWSSIYNLVPTAIWVTSPASEPVRLSKDPPRRRKISENAVWIGATIIVALLLLIPVGGVVFAELGRKDQIEKTRTPAPPSLPASDPRYLDAELRRSTEQIHQSLEQVNHDIVSLVGWMLLVQVAIAGIGLILFAFWLWMLIHVVTKEPEGSDKIVWTLVVVFTGPIGATIYFFARYTNRDSAYAR